MSDDNRDRDSLTGQAREILLSVTSPQPLAELGRKHSLNSSILRVAVGQLVADHALVSWVEGAKRGRRRIVAPAGTALPPGAVTGRKMPRSTSSTTAPASGIVAAAILLEARDLDDKTARTAALSLLRKARQ